MASWQHAARFICGGGVVSFPFRLGAPGAYVGDSHEDYIPQARFPILIELTNRSGLIILFSVWFSQWVKFPHFLNFFAWDHVLDLDHHHYGIFAKRPEFYNDQPDQNLRPPRYDKILEE